MRQLLKKPLRERPWNYEMSLGSTWDGTIAGKVTSASEARARIQAAQIIATGRGSYPFTFQLTNLLH